MKIDVKIVKDPDAYFVLMKDESLYLETDELISETFGITLETYHERLLTKVIDKINYGLNENRLCFETDENGMEIIAIKYREEFSIELETLNSAQSE